MTPNSDFQFMYKESGNSMTTAKLQSARLLPHWRPSRLRYDKNSKKMFCDYCIKNGVTTKYHVKKQRQRVLMHLLLLLSKHEIGKYQDN